MQNHTTRFFFLLLLGTLMPPTLVSQGQTQASSTTILGWDNPPTDQSMAALAFHVYTTQRLELFELNKEEQEIFIKHMKQLLEGTPPDTFTDQVPKALAERYHANRLRVATQNKAKALEVLENLSPDFKPTESGIRYKIHRQGTGDTPKDKDQVEVEYRVRTFDGTPIYDTSGNTELFDLEQVLPGFKEVLQLLNTRAIGEFYIPPLLLYGDEGAANIPPGMTLQYMIELVRIHPKSE